jgi:hypothetical protein
MPVPLQPPPGVSLQHNRRFPTTVLDRLVEVAIQDGTHSALHILTNTILHPGLGAPTMNHARAFVLTRRVRSRILNRYVGQHYASYDDISTTLRGVQLNNPVSITRQAQVHSQPPTSLLLPIITQPGCFDCFRFLVERCQLPVTGYFRNGKSFLYRAIQCNTPTSIEIARYILLEMPPICLPMPLEVNLIQPHIPLYDTISTMVSSGQNAYPVFDTWVRAMFNARAIIPNLIAVGQWPLQQHFTFPLQMLYMAPQMSFTTASQLLALGIHIGDIYLPAMGTMLNRMLIAQNPDRHDIIRHIMSIPFTPSNTFPQGTSVNTPSYCQIGTSILPPGRWPPWTVACALGDNIAAAMLSRNPLIDPLARGQVIPTPPPITAPRLRTAIANFDIAPLSLAYWSLLPGPNWTALVGLGAAHHINLNGVLMIRQWVRRGCPAITTQWPFSGLCHVLEQIIETTSNDRIQIQTLPRPPTVSPSAWKAQKARRRREKLRYAAQMIREIVDHSMRDVLNPSTGASNQPQIRRLSDIAMYRIWLRAIKRYIKGIYPGAHTLYWELNRSFQIYRRDLRPRQR